jgi:hypothetical protein
MNSYEKSNYVLTDRGDVDVNFYINKAHHLRNQAIKAYWTGLVDNIKETADSMTSLRLKSRDA